MKTQTTIIFWTCLFLANHLVAASGGPDTFGYTWLDSNEISGPNYQWIEPTADAVTLLENNTATAANFELAVPWGGIYGQKVRELRVSRNGYLTDNLTESGNDETNDCPLPDSPSVGGGNRLYVVHDDLELDISTGRVSYQYFQNSPHSLHTCGVHIITWQDIHHETGATGRFSFQALLFDNFDILYQFAAGNPELGSGSTTGLQNASATSGLGISCNQANLAENYSILIRPPVLLVNTMNDEFNTPSGSDLSLREAIRDAANGSRIEFTYSASIVPIINLSAAGRGQNSRFSLNNRNLSLDGSSAPHKPTISGGQAVRHFLLQNNTHLALRDIRMTHGRGTSIFANGAGGSTRLQGGSSLVGHGCEYVQNSTANEGGALFLDDANSFVNQTQGKFLANSSTGAGGAIAVRENATLQLFETNLWLNRSLNSAGGALSLRNATFKMTSCDLAENEAKNSGGAIVANVDVTGTIHASTFDSNTATNGGAIAVENGSGTSALPARLSFSRSTFFENLALSNGGAIYENSSNSNSVTATLDLAHCTVYRNSAGAGGGGFSVRNGSITFQGTCVADNVTRGNDNNFSASGTGLPTTFGDNLESGTDMNFTGPADLQEEDPRLTRLGYHGGWVRTCFPLEGSPLLDAAVQGSAASTFDARGIASFQNGDPDAGLNSGSLDYDDIGAVELAPPRTLADGATFAELNSAMLSAPTGSSIRLGNNPRILMQGSINPQSGKILMIEGSIPTILVQPQLFFSNQQLSFHGLTFDGNRNAASASSLAMGTTIPRGTLNFEECEFRLFSNSLSPLLKSNKQLALSHCQFRDNLTAQCISTSSDWFVLRDTHFMENTTQGTRFTDHLLVYAQGSSLLSRLSFLGNQTHSQGNASSALIALSSNPRDRTTVSRVRNCTFAHNKLSGSSANSAGDGLIVTNLPFNLQPAFTLFDHLTMVGNKIEGNNPKALIQSNAGLQPGSLVATTNSLFADNSSLPVFLNTTSNGGNLSDTFLPGAQITDRENTTPLLGPLALGRNGTRHFTLLPNSPAIDGSLLQTAGSIDGRGTIRYIDGDANGTTIADIGAIEAGESRVVTTELDENNGALGLGAGDSLRECIESARLSPVSISFASGQNNFELTEKLTLNTPHTLDLNLAGQDCRLGQAQVFSGLTTFGDEACVLFNSIRGGSNTTFTTTNGSSALHLHGLKVEDHSGTLVLGAGSSRVLLTQTQANDLELDFNSGFVLAASASNVEIEDSVFARNTNSGSGTLFSSGGNKSALTLTRAHLNENAFSASLLSSFSPSRLRQVTYYRNGSLPLTWNASTSNLQFEDSILAANSGSSALAGPPEKQFSLGRNLSNRGGNSLDHIDDIIFRQARLAPLYDYNGDGLEEAPPLATSPAFGTSIGAVLPPPVIIEVNTAANENNIPAGPDISLREAVRDIAEGGTIIFAPTLNNAILSTGELLPDRSMTIDASRLASGIDIVGRFSITNPDTTLTLHAIHCRNHNALSQDGGSVKTAGNLVASLCTFSENTNVNSAAALDVDGDLILENCTFTNLTSNLRAIIRLNGNGTSRISYCTFGECISPNGGIIDLGPDVELKLFANLFLDNNAPPVALNTPQDSRYNIYGQSVAFASSTDLQNVSSSNFHPLRDDGGYGPTYPYLPLTGVNDHANAFGTGTAQPPETDGRGFMRWILAGVDSGSHELGGEFFFADDTGDNDGIPAWWELQHGLDPTADNDTALDSDGDGSGLLEEYLWGTNPNDENSFFTCQILPTGILSWSTEPGYLYRIESNEDLVGTWGEVETMVGNGGNQTYQFPSGPLALTKDFFRIRKVSP